MNWEVFLLPMDEKFVSSLKLSGNQSDKCGVFYKGNFNLAKTGDTFIDMSQYKKGLVWVNGHNLGRYWDIGPQKRLYCPAPWLNQGENEIVVFDLLQAEPKPVGGFRNME